MITPLLPIFLTLQLGAGPAIVGLIEGAADAVSSVLKLVSGRLVDRGWDARRLVIGGYAASNAVRPLIGLALSWTWVLGLRFADRLGKGLRTSPRDGIIAASTAQGRRGLAFGFHRSLDPAGAVLGPLLAFALLALGADMREVFLFSVVPGVLVILLLVFGLPRQPSAVPADVMPVRLDWRRLDARLRALVLAAGVLAMATTPEVFLVLWAQNRGLELLWLPLLWAAASAVKAVCALFGGVASDRLGRLPVVVAGWGLRILMLLAIATASGTAWTIWLLFLLYAASVAVTEGAERALIGDLAPAAQRGTAFGLYHMLAGLLVLPGAVLFGVLWEMFSAGAAFFAAAALTAAAVVTLVAIATAPPHARGERH
jgi:MFS family permease